METSTYQKHLSMVVPYSITVSTLYLFGFWGAFDVNIFEYIGISDVLKIAVYQLAHYGVFLVMGAIIGDLILAPKLREALPPGEGRHLPEAKYFRFLVWVTFILILGAILYTIFFTSDDGRWFRVAALLMPIIPTLLQPNDFLEGIIKSYTLRTTVVNLMAYVLIFSYGWGGMDAAAHKKNEINVILDGTEQNKSYVGRAGGYIFLWERSSESIEVISANTVKSLKYNVPSTEAILGFLINSDKESNKSSKQDAVTGAPS